MNERIYLINLFDCYYKLLTDNEIEIFKQYHEEDLSLQEIAENKNISRSAVSKTLKVVSEKLNDYENKLNNFSIKEKVLKLIEEKNLDELKEIFR